MTEFERVEKMRREWTMTKLVAVCEAETPEFVVKPKRLSVQGVGVQFQQCGGGRRVLRKRIGGE